MGLDAGSVSASSPSGSRREGRARAPSPKASRALRIQFFVLIAAIACAFLGHTAAVAITTERKLALQRFGARLSAVMDSWHQLLMTTHRLPYREERPKESWIGGVQVFGEFRASLEAFQQEVDRERLLDPTLRQDVIDLLRGLRYGNQFIQEVYDELEAFIRSNQQGNRPILGTTMYGILRDVGGYDFEADHLMHFFRMYQDVRDLGFSFTNLLENKQQRIQTAIQSEIARLTRLYTAIQAALLVFAASALAVLLLRQVAVFRAVQQSEQDILRLNSILRRSEAYLAEAQRLARIGSWAVDARTGETRYWSEETFRIWGLDPKQGLPTLDQLVEQVHPDDRDRFKEQGKFLRKEDWAEKFRLVLPDGTVKNMEVIGHPVLDVNGELLEYVGTSIDVTERKRAEAAREGLRQLEADLARISRVATMSEMAAAVAHEVRQPITAATVNASACVRWIAREPPNLEKARAAAERMVDETTRAAEIIKRVASLYRKSSPQREAVDLNEVARETLALLRSEADRQRVTVRAALAPGLPSVAADRVQMQQVLMNLVLNAIEAMQGTGGELNVRSELGENGEIMLSVSDTGVGLPPQAADTIFQAFFTTKPHGTGMGLRISRSIVEAHGGRLWADSEAGRGATFHFTLPTAAGSRPVAGDASR